MPYDPLYDVPMAARKMRVTEETIRRWIRAGLLPDRRVAGSRQYLILKSDLSAKPCTHCGGVHVAGECIPE